MPGRVMRFDDRIGAVPGMPRAADLADLWLAKALAFLLDACDVPASARRDLLDSGIDTLEPEIPPASSPAAEKAQLERLDASRLALVLAELAVEARLNRVLRHCDAVEWQAIAHLAPAEKLRLAPQLLDDRRSSAKGADLYPLVDELVDVREALVEAGGWSTGSAARFGPSLACAMVEASAKICCFLASLTDEAESDTARIAQRAAETLVKRADALSLFRFRDSAYYESSSRADIDFPPDLPEW